MVKHFLNRLDEVDSVVHKKIEHQERLKIGAFCKS